MGSSLSACPSDQCPTIDTTPCVEVQLLHAVESREIDLEAAWRVTTQFLLLHLLLKRRSTPRSLEPVRWQCLRLEGIEDRQPKRRQRLPNPTAQSSAQSSSRLSRGMQLLAFSMVPVHLPVAEASTKTRCKPPTPSTNRIA